MALRTYALVIANDDCRPSPPRSETQQSLGTGVPAPAQYFAAAGPLPTGPVAQPLAQPESFLAVVGGSLSVKLSLV